uniref:Prostaglandin D2 receptor 2 n=1 Tax=Sander lucioperca TaxID=283035 RepID=A0A8C9XXQ9_SANLU
RQASATLICPLLQMMKEHSPNNNTQANMVVVCIHGLVSCLGILENALILWVVGFRLRRRTVASVWVLNLAASDFLATLTLPLFTFYLSSSHSWELGSILCKTQASIFFLNMFVSAFLLAAISVDRCLLAAKPVWSQNHRSVAGAWKVCLLGWLWAAINTLPYLLFRSVTEKQDKKKLCYHNFALYSSSQDTLETDCKVRQAATAISKLLLAFLFPLVVIAGSYIQIVLSLRYRNRRRNFTKMVTFVIAAFVLCWAPYHIVCMIEVSAEYWKQNLHLVEVGFCPKFSVRIRQSLGAVFDGLVEEGGGFLLVPGKSLRAHIQRKSSRDVSLASPGSQKGSQSPCISPDIQQLFPLPSPSEGLRNTHMDI